MVHKGVVDAPQLKPLNLKVFKDLIAFLLRGNIMAGEKSTVTKADIVEKVYQKIGFSKKEASELVEMVFNQLKDTLCVGDKS